MLARIKIKLGENEIEVESRDFYVDNNTIGKIIDNLSSHLPENQGSFILENQNVNSSMTDLSRNGLEYLDNAEAFEPEFNEPEHIASSEIKSKLRILETNKFFNLPRTVTETVQQLREYGWAASPLDVSKALARMASNKEIMKNSSDNRLHYFAESIIAN